MTRHVISTRVSDLEARMAEPAARLLGLLLVRALPLVLVQEQAPHSAVPRAGAAGPNL